MEATGGSSAYYPKQVANVVEKDHDHIPHASKQPTDAKDKEFGGDISSICIAPFEDD